MSLMLRENVPGTQEPYEPEVKSSFEDWMGCSYIFVPEMRVQVKCFALNTAV